MNPTETTAEGAVRPGQGVLPAGRGMQRPPRINPEPAPAAPAAPSPRRGFYGLPCAKCKTYYAADLKACPVCHASERVSPRESSEAALAAPVSEYLTETTATSTLDEERERFLRSFKTQLQVSKLEINTVDDHQCRQAHNHHPGTAETATVCERCYEEMRSRVDVMEAALHMDLKEATSVVYEAVWADPSDPSKTYQNAAQALLTELRRRAGVSLVLGPLQPLPH